MANLSLPYEPHTKRLFTHSMQIYLRCIHNCWPLNKILRYNNAGVGRFVNQTLFHKTNSKNNYDEINKNRIILMFANSKFASVYHGAILKML